MDHNNQVIQRGRPVSGVDAAHANEYFEQFVNASTLKHILGYYRGITDNLHLKPNVFSLFYPKLRANLTSWRAKALWKKFDARASHKCYGKGKLAGSMRVLIIGGGPCGLRTAIEAQLLGAKVVVIEKRDRFSRNNVLHLWPFVIEDLRMLGAKKFFGKFCAGAIDHISIRQLQCILLKVALLLGIEVHTEVSFEKLIEPNATEKTGWRAECKPANHPVHQYEFDVIIGADGKRNTLQGFSRKEFRGKLAIAITANFINRKTEAEARVEEISGVAFIFNQKFFKELQEETRIDLENIVYYKDDTHYFVMTAKKASLLEKGVIKQDLADTEKLLAPENVDREALEQYAIDAANFSTNYMLPNLEFAVNHYGQPDIAMFDFTSMYAAENASKVVERNGYKLLMILVGDSLLEPFWPTGSGCARGFLSSLDAAWAIRSWCTGNCTPLDVLAERESIYRLLAQTTPDNLNKDWKSYTLDPATRYPNLNRSVVLTHQIIGLYDTDNTASIEKMKRNSYEKPSEIPRKRRRGNVDNDVLLTWLKDQLKEEPDIEITDIEEIFKGGKVLCAIIHHYRPDLLDYNSIKDDDPAKNNQLAFDILEKELGIPPVMTGEEITNTEDYLTMATYLTEVYDTFRGEIPHIKHPKLDLPESNKYSDFSFKTVKTVNIPSAFITQQPRPSSRHKRHIDMTQIKPSTIDNKKTRKRRTLERVGASVDHENKSSGATARTGGADEDLAARIKNLEQKWNEPQPVEKKPKDLLRAIGKIETSDWNIKEIEKKIMENKMGKPNKAFDKEKVPKWSKEQFLARQTKMEKQHLDRQDSSEAKFADIDKSIKNLDQKIKEGTVRQLGTRKIATITEKLVNKVPPEPKPPEKPTTRNPVILPAPNVSEFCHFCQKRVYLMERLSAEGRFFHHSCFKCQYCQTQLRLGSYAFDRDGLYGFKFFCLHHYGMVSEIQQPTTTVIKKPSLKLMIDQRNSPEMSHLPGIVGVDLLDRVQTPERVEFSNLSSGHISSDHEEPLSQMDEDEWTDKNFGASCAELADSDDESSSLSDTDSDDEDMFDDALEEPVTKEGTMKWAERWKNSYSKKKHNSDTDGYSSSDRSSYYDSSEDDESDTATEGEEEIRARELRKQEVCVEPPVVQTDTGTDTEIVSDESSSDSSSEVHNSATEISTDSEFAQDDPTPTRELPHVFSDFNVTKKRGSGRNYPKKIQVTSGFLQKPINEKTKTKQSRQNIELKLKPLVPLTPIKKTAPLLLPRTEGYSLNRTQSTGGIAAKVSLELKKKYLLGESTAGSIQKSGSASTLDTKFKTFQTTISDCQKLLKPAPEISASMQTFVTKLDERKSPILSPQSSIIFGKDINKEESPKDQQEVPVDIFTKVTEQESESDKNEVFQNESEGRPRSPVHETSIIVPQIDWSKNNQSLSSDSLASSGSENEQDKPKQFENIPRVEVHEAKDENLLDSLTDAPLDDNRSTITSTHSEAPKSISTEKKSLNQPKTLPSLETLLPEIHNSLHIKFSKPDIKLCKEMSEIEVKSQKNSSGLSSPDSVAEQITTALTETELSDWARDEVVSDDFEEVAYETSRKQAARIAKMTEFDDVSQKLENKHSFSELKSKTVITEAMNNLLSANLDNIEFMDTGTETSSDDGIPDSQNGYVLFKNEDEFAEDSLNPNINEILEAKNVHINEKESKNTGYCIIADDIAEETTNLNKPVEIEKSNKNFLSVSSEHEEDSLMVLETTGTTTEENTISDSTVKNVTEISVDKQISQDKPLPSENNNKLKQRLEEKLAEIKAEAKLKEQTNVDNKQQDNIEFEEHCKRLQSKVEFGNVRDSIDIRKSRRKSKSDSPQKPDLIQEEKIENKDITLNLSPNPHTPDILYNKDVIKKERDINQKLIQEMVMNKMRAENKSLERKKRMRPVVSPSSPFALSKSATTDIVSDINLSNLDKSNRKSTYSTSSSNYSTPDVLLSTNIIPLQNSISVSVLSETSTPSVPKNNRPLAVYSLDNKISEDANATSFKGNRSVTVSEEQFTPKAPPRQNRLNSDDVNRKLEKLKQTAKLKNKENTNIEENTNTIFMNTERKNSCLYSNDTLNKKRNNSFRRSKSGDSETQTSKLKLSLSSTNLQHSVPEIPKSDLTIKQIDLATEREKMCKSDPNILETEKAKPKKKNKDRERRKSITKLITTLFTKKSPGSNSSKGLFSKLSPKSKEISKSVVKEPVRRSSFSEVSSARNVLTPPPVPPLPLNYRVKGTDESSEGEAESRKEHSSCDTLDKLGTLEFSTSSNTHRRSSKALRAARQAQLKRHRMAQEIQRKLEETEVKTKELESRGVLVEKALRGEDDGKYSKKDESELLQEWFDLMRDRTELRRYERELMVRAQELELEDRHARLQHELRERLENNESKTEKELKIEEDIINEMMAIVAERDSLIAVIEEDRLRYSNEDRDIEEQMLAKGLRLTPIKKSPEK